MKHAGELLVRGNMTSLWFGGNDLLHEILSIVFGHWTQRSRVFSFQARYPMVLNYIPTVIGRNPHFLIVPCYTPVILGGYTPYLPRRSLLFAGDSP